MMHRFEKAEEVLWVGPAHCDVRATRILSAETTQKRSEKRSDEILTPKLWLIRYQIALHITGAFEGLTTTSMN